MALDKTRYYILQDKKVSQDCHYATFAWHFLCIRNRLKSSKILKFEYYARHANEKETSCE